MNPEDIAPPLRIGTRECNVGGYAQHLARLPGEDAALVLTRDRLHRVETDELRILWTFPEVVLRFLVDAPRRRLIGVSRTGELLLISSDDGRLIDRLEGRDPRVEPLAVSADGSRMLLRGGGMLLAVWNLRSGSRRLVPSGGVEDEFAWTGFAPDGRRVVRASRWLRVDDLRTGGRVLDAGDEDPKVTRKLAVGPLGERAVLAHDRDGWVVEARELFTGRLEWRYEELEWVTALAFSPDGARLAIGDSYRGLLLLDAASGVRLWHAPAGSPGPTVTKVIRGLAFSPDGAELAMAERGVHRLDVATGETREVHFSAEDTEGYGVAYSGEGDLWAVLRDESGTRVQNMGEETGPPLPGLRGWVEDVAFHLGPGTPRVAWREAGDRLSVMDLDRGEVVLERGGAKQAVWSPDGGLLAVDGIRLVAFPGGEELTPLPTFPALVEAVCVSPDGARVATACGGEVALWDWMDEDSAPRRLASGLETNPFDTAFAFGPGELAVQADRRTVLRLRLEDGEELGRYETANEGVELEYLDGTLELRGYRRCARIDLATGEPDPEAHFEPEDSSALRLEDGRRLRVGPYGDLSLGEPSPDPDRRKFRGLSPVPSSPHLLVIPDRPGRSELLEPISGEVLREFPLAMSLGNPVALSPDGTRLVHGEAGRVRVLSLETGETLGETLLIGAPPPEHAHVVDGELLVSSPPPLPLSLREPCFAPDGALVAGLLGEAPDWSIEVRLWSVPELEQVWSNSLQPDPGEHPLGFLVDPEAGELLLVVDFDDGWSLRRLARGWSRLLHLWEPLPEVAQLEVPRAASAWVLSPHRGWIGMRDDQHLRILDPRGRELFRGPAPPWPGRTSSAVDPEGRRLAYPVDRDRIRVDRIGGGGAAFELPADQGAVVDLAFCDHGRRLASLGADGTLLVWELPG